jgi:hypothetical protein
LPAAALDALRAQINPLGLTPPNPGADQTLTSQFVQLVNVSPPNPALPTEPAPFDFCYWVPTNDFAAVDAYYYCDALFRLIQGMGFAIGNYFDGTVFPARVDHPAMIGLPPDCPNRNCVNASAPGNVLGHGSDGFRFALVQANQPVGMAADWRVVLHEFGHTILWDHVNAPNFGFAHSCGDNLASIVNAPESQALDLGRTFPWSGLIIRRHDRPVTGGWAWGGVNDHGGYLSEQIPLDNPLPLLSGDRWRLYARQREVVCRPLRGIPHLHGSGHTQSLDEPE